MAEIASFRGQKAKGKHWLLLWIGLLSCFVVGALYACQPIQDFNIELVYHNSLAPNQKVLSGFSVTSAIPEGTQVATEKLIEGENKIHCDKSHARGETPTRWLVAEGMDKDQQKLEGIIPFSRELCLSGRARIVMMRPDYQGRLVAQVKQEDRSLFKLVDVPGSFGHAAAAFEHGRVLLMGGLSGVVKDMRYPPSLLRPEQRPLYKDNLSSEGWLYDAETQTLRKASLSESNEVLRRAFHTLTVSGERGLLVGGWGAIVGPLPNWAPTFSLTFKKPEKPEDWYRLDDFFFEAKQESPSIEIASHISLLADAKLGNLDSLILLGGQAPLKDLPRSPMEGGCRPTEQRVFLALHAAVVVPQKDRVIFSGGVWVQGDGTLLPPQNSNAVWNLPLKDVRAANFFCAQEDPSTGAWKIRLLTGTKEFSPTVFPAGAARAGHSMTLVDGQILIYGGFELPRRWENTPNVFEVNGGFAGVRRDAYWLSVEGENLTWKQVGLERAEPLSGTCEDLLLPARALHQATRLLDGRILLSGGVRCLNNQGGEGCSNGKFLHHYSLLLYTPKGLSSSAQPPENLVFHCVPVGGASQDDSSKTPISRVFHTATLLSSGRVLLWGGITSDSNLQNPRLTGTPEIFSPQHHLRTLGGDVRPPPSEKLGEDAGPEGSPPEDAGPEDAGPGEVPELISPEQPEPPTEETRPEIDPTLKNAAFFSLNNAEIKNLQVFVDKSKTVHLFFALKGFIKDLNGANISSAKNGTAWSLVRLHYGPNFQSYFAGIVIDEIRESAVWRVALHPKGNKAVLSGLCSGMISNSAGAVSLCPTGNASGAFVLLMGYDSKAGSNPLSPLWADILYGDIVSLERLRLHEKRDTQGNPDGFDVVWLGAAISSFASTTPYSMFNYQLPRKTGVALRISIGESDAFQTASVILAKSSHQNASSSAVDYAWLTDGQTACLLLNTQEDVELEAQRADGNGTMKVLLGKAQGGPNPSALLSCFGKDLDGVVVWTMPLPGPLPLRGKQLSVGSSGSSQDVFLLYEQEVSAGKYLARVMHLQPFEKKIRSLWEPPVGSDLHSVSPLAFSGSLYPLFFGQSAKDLLWGGLAASPTLSLYAPSLPNFPNGYAFPISASNTTSLIQNSSIGVLEDDVVVGGVLESGESIDFPAYGSYPSQKFSGKGLFVFFWEDFPPQRSTSSCVHSNTQACPCLQNTSCSGCCDSLGLCQPPGVPTAAPRFFCGGTRQVCESCEQAIADRCISNGCSCGGSSPCLAGVERCEGTAASAMCNVCRPTEVELSFKQMSYKTGTLSMEAGQLLYNKQAPPGSNALEMYGYLHRVAEDVMQPEQTIVVGIWREGYGAEAWGCVSKKLLSNLGCSSGKELLFLDLGTKRPSPEIRAPHWEATSTSPYKFIAMAILGQPSSCDAAMETFMSMDHSKTPSRLSFSITKPAACLSSPSPSPTSFSIQKVSLQDALGVFASPTVEAKVGEEIGVSFPTHFNHQGLPSNSFRYGLFDALGNPVLSGRCFGLSSADYCSSAKNLGLQKMLIPAGASLGAGLYYFRAGVAAVDCSVNVPLQRNMTAGALRLIP